MEPTLQHRLPAGAGRRASHLWWAAPAAGVAAALLNLGLYYVAIATGLLPAGLRAPSGEVIGPVQVVLASVVPALLGGVVMAALIRWANRPLQAFTIIVVGIGLLSLVGPATVPSNSPSGVAVLGLMHVVAAAVVWWFFSRYTRS